jgi:hypothetical protein
VVLRMGRDGQTMTVQAPRDVWGVVRERAAGEEREDLTEVIDDALEAEPTKLSVRVTAPYATADALYALSVPQDDEDTEA